MKVYKGRSVFGGIVMGKIRVYHRRENQVKRMEVKNPESEILRYHQAAREAVNELKALYGTALEKAGEAGAEIFEIHRMMLEDGDYRESVEKIIRGQGVNAEYAVAQTGDHFARMFASMEDDYMRSRAADVRDISGRLLRVLRGEDTEGMEGREPVILVADELTPSETVQLDRDRVLAFVTVQGSMNSHMAILAKTMGIPTLVGVDFLPEDMIDGKTGIVDGIEGAFYVEPDENALDRLRKIQQKELLKGELLQALKGRESITLDGQRIRLYANMGNIDDLASVLQNDAEGIGLFRSEFIYMGREDFPTEEEQFEIYRAAAQAMGERCVVIRTLDIGADKQCDYFKMEREENPAMGCRGIRMCLARPEIFKTQLRALLRASAYGKIAIMYPMIASVWEVRKIKEIVKEVKEELKGQGFACGEPRQGIMIETPAAAIISDLLAEEADFFSIGTNDLTQYLLAADRQNMALDEFCDPHHPAVLRMIGLVVENAHRAGIRVGICGELGADMELTREFLAMGVDELSVSPGRILPIRQIVRGMDVSEYKRVRGNGCARR